MLRSQADRTMQSGENGSLLGTGAPLRWLTIICTAVCMFDASSSVILAQESRSKSAPEQVISLRGKLTSRKTWGPPNQGQTPKKEIRFTIFTLKLTEAMTSKQLALSKPERDDKKYSEVQLRCWDVQCEARLKESVGREVAINGSADYAVYPTDVLPVIIDVHSIDRGRR